MAFSVFISMRKLIYLKKFINYIPSFVYLVCGKICIPIINGIFSHYTFSFYVVEILWLANSPSSFENRASHTITITRQTFRFHISPLTLIYDLFFSFVYFLSMF